MNKIFVYGTLRKGEENGHLLNNAKCLERNCWTYGLLYDTGYGYPAIAPSTTYKTYGELYLVTDSELKLLDELEDYEKDGTDNLYDRVVQEIFTSNNGSTTAYVYVANKEKLKFKDIPSGDWIEFRSLSQK